MSKIEWTGKTWNPVTGCDKISPGCKRCYAEVMTRRLRGMGIEKYSAGFGKVVTHRSELEQPYKWKSGQLVFVNSMSDLFHKDVPIGFIQDVFTVMNNNYQHTFQVLTKRADLLAEYDTQKLLSWTPNIWQGVSVESPTYKFRIDYLRTTQAKVKFLSLEPLIKSLGKLDLSGIDWVIVGGESSHKPRVMAPEWVREIRDQCQEQRVPFFFKQWGGRNKKAAGRLLDGRTYDDMPSRVAE